ncbi:MAG: 16S rRNA (cytosine(1402)-N(4))-methyltransferase RsmH [Eubacteriales bacterium]|nr:16S rRNA (cytosine(1402)-N(4))-methyltransferase RsmH [Eubacteriales bacterium]
MSSYRHDSVLLAESIRALAPEAGAYYVDCTLGGGGHSLAILEASDGLAHVLGVDRDQWAIEAATARIAKAGYEGSFTARQARFSELKQILNELKWPRVDGLIADLGFSSPQIDSAERGFSYLHDGPLDMRMDQNQEMTASKLLAIASEAELAKIFKEFGEERRARSIARAIVQRRDESPIETTEDLANLVANQLPARERRAKHPARKVFQALRIAVNGELTELEKLLELLPEVMAEGSTAAIISFHSLEARAVRQAFRRFENPCQCPKNLPCNCGMESLGRALKDVQASAREITENPRARSAQLRCFRFEQSRKK